MRISRISRHGALRDSSVYADTFETIGESIVNAIDIAEIDDVKLTKSTGDIENDHSQVLMSLGWGFR